MKTIFLSISIFLVSLGLNAQDLSAKIPSDADAVVAIKGKNLTKLVSVDQFSTSKLGQILGKELSQESDGRVKSIKDAGFDLEQNFYYFLDVKEGVFTNCFLAPLKDPQGFTNLLSASEKERIRTKNGLSYFQNEYDGTVTLWNNNTLILMFAEDQSSGYDYYDDYGYYDEFNVEEGVAVVEEEATESVEAAVDNAEDAGEVVEIKEIEIESVEEEDYIEETIIESTEDSDEDVIEETVIESTESYSDYYNSNEYKREQAERERKRKERDAQREIKRKELSQNILKKAMTVMAGNYGQGNIMKNPSYVKSIGNGGEEASAWVADFGRIYKDGIFGGYLFGASDPYSFMDIDRFYGGMSVAAKLDFKEDHAAIRMEYSMNTEMADLYRQIYDGKLNPSFANYMNEDRMLGYWSVNMSIEGILNAYPDMIDKLIDNKETTEYSDAISLGTHLFSVLLDEKGAAEIVRGDMVLVLNDLSERTVTYTDYEYDEDYNYIEVEKTKTESVPDFMFMFSSQQKELFDRLIRIGIKEGEIEAMNNIYRIKNLGNSSPFEIYMMFKDDICFVGSSKRDLMAISTGTFKAKLSGVHAKNMKKSTSSMYVNGKKIIAQIPLDAYPSELRDKVGFLTQNTEDVQFKFEKIKGNTMKGEMIWNTATTGHNNSFDYFLNMIEGMID